MKKQAMVIIILVVIIFILSAVIGYFVYDEWFRGESKKKNSGADVSKKEDLSLTDPLVTQLYSYVSFGQDYFNRNYYFLENKKITVADFENDQKFFYAFPLIDYSKITVEKNNEINFVDQFSIPEDAYDEAIKKLLGPSVTYQKEGSHQVIPNWDQSVTKEAWGIANFQYDEVKKAYTGQTTGFGGANAFATGAYTKLVSAIKEGTKIYLKEKFVYVEPSNIREDPDSDDTLYTYDVYADPQKTMWIDRKENVRVFSNEEKLSPIDLYFEQANTVNYEFELGSDGVYHFVQSKIEK